MYRVVGDLSDSGRQAHRLLVGLPPDGCIFGSGGGCPADPSAFGIRKKHGYAALHAGDQHGGVYRCGGHYDRDVETVNEAIGNVFSSIVSECFLSPSL